MSKLIIDDVELADGNLFSIPSNFENNKVAKIGTDGKISAFESLPEASFKLVHDFSVSQPTTITHTLTQDSSKLMCLIIKFIGIQRYNTSGTNRDMHYLLENAAGENSATGSGTSNPRQMQGISNSSSTHMAASYNTGGNSISDEDAFPVHGVGSNLDVYAPNDSTPWANFLHAEHHVFFSKHVVSGATRYDTQFIAETQTPHQRGTEHMTTAIHISCHSSYALSNANFPYIKSGQYNKIIFTTHSANHTFLGGQIKIMEIPR
jgi:hypothetical protein